ncbi:MAG TPA: DUF1549 domain-containing protein, partial [Fimbriimonadaceae bacterium]|nr:DUF1549 domain-containing protein [Fimbriimonadaceae bacterium]
MPIKPIPIAPICATALLATGIWADPGSPVTSHKPPAPKLDFNRDIRPILDKCLSCHGHDPKAIQAGLKLDSRDGATKVLADGRTAIVPGRPERSELVRRINASDKSDLMPPPSSNRLLAAEEKSTLAEWIRQGAEYKPHWAFVKPVRQPPPSVRLAAWPRNSIDRFILARLESEGLRPSPEADRSTLLRRVSLDLTGLPPSPAELAAFRSDRSANAYEKVVDRLLASPRYGERMAMDWLDCARYADSNGYQNDYERYQYRWRDWVIDAFNRNMPYDEFTVDQLAGDLLPHPTLDQLIATGFNRNNRTNSEGGALPEEWLTEYVIDRVETTSEVWLGLTAGCARCHDHKYDPITQRDFYSLYAYFNNVPETVIGPEAAINYPPTIKAPYPEQAKELARLSARFDILDGKVSEALAGHMAAAEALDPKALARPEIPNGRLGEFKVGTAAGRSTGSIRTDDKSFLELGAAGDFEWNQPFSYGAWVKREGDLGSPLSRMDDANSYRGWDLHVVDGKPAMHLIHKWPDNAIKVVAKSPIPKGEWTHLFVTYDGSGKAEGVRLYVNGVAVPLETAADSLTGTTRTNVATRVGRRTDGARFTGEVDDVLLYSRVLSVTEVAWLSSVSPALPLLSIPPEKRTYAERLTITREWLRATDPAFRSLDDERAATVKRKRELENRIPTVMVMEEMPKPRPAYVLIRGQYDKHGELVTACIPGFLQPAKPKAGPTNLQTYKPTNL